MTDEDARPAPPRARAIENATGVPFDVWTARLEDAGGRGMDHAALARTIHERWNIEDWWAQGIAIAFEQSIGRRDVGQTSTGDFAVSASRTVPSAPDAVLEAWDAFQDAARREQLGLGEARTSSTEAWRYWRVDGPDGSRVSMNLRAKDDGAAGGAPRSILAIEHKGLADADAREAWKTTWKHVLDAFVATLEETR